MTPEQRTRALRHYTAEASVALRIEQLEAALRPLAGIPLEEFGWGSHRPDQPITGWNRHTLYVRDVLAARTALANVEAARTGANT